MWDDPILSPSPKPQFFNTLLMIVVIAMLVGIYDVAGLILIFALNATMILFGLMMELHNQTTARTNWTSFWFGSFAGIVPWVAIFLYLVGAGRGEGGPPGFVYGIFVSIGVLTSWASVGPGLSKPR